MIMAQAKRTETDGLSKFQRYRLQQRHRGMKLLRVWVPDPHQPEFVAEATRQGMLLRGRPEEVEALEFIDSAFEWPQP
jgi:hypothetical protein